MIVLMKQKGLVNTVRLLRKKTITAVRLLHKEGLKSFLRIMRDKVLAKTKIDLQIKRSSHKDDYYIWKNAPIEKDSDILVYLAYTPDGSLSSIHRKQINDYQTAGFQLIIIINTPQWFAMQKSIRDEQALAKSVIVMVRDNTGYDFGGWSHLLRSVSDFGCARTISFTNDSIIVVDQIKLQKLRLKIKDTNDAWFLTENLELSPHGQSYFFGFKARCLNSVFNHISDIPIYSDKWDLIFNEELHLSNRFKNSGLKVNFLFDVSYNKNKARDKTIEDWSDLIQNGFPFLKLQLFQKNFLQLDDSKVVAMLGASTCNAVKEHLKHRSQSVEKVQFEFGKALEPSIKDTTLFDRHGVLKSYNQDSSVIPSIVLPLGDVESFELLPKKVLIVIHAYYDDLAISMLEQILGIFEKLDSVSYDLVVTTDKKSKMENLTSWIANSNYSKSLLDIICIPNRGRNVAPFLIACKKYLNDHDLILHLHTKKSLHDVNLADWNEHLTNSLVGSEANLKSIMAMFEVKKLGLVYPGHHKSVFNLRNWGFNFQKAQDILYQMGIKINVNNALDFPTGMMFWVRSEALGPLLDLDIKQSSFDVEMGQIDGTLAHSIERSLNHIVESKGYKTQSVTSSEKIGSLGGRSLRLSLQSCFSYLNNTQPRLKNIAKPHSLFNKKIKEIYDISFASSDIKRKRLNIILPSVEPYQIYGGISSAIEQAMRLWRSMDAATDLRFVITLDNTTVSGLKELARRINNIVMKTKPFFDEDGISLVSVYADRHLPLSIRSGDIFFATAWWTADLGFRLRSAQLEFFENAPKLVYFVQDYEPMFYGLSDKFALALKTYLNPEDTIFIINSEELANYFVSKHPIKNGYCLPYTLNIDLQDQTSALEKYKIILVYGRPTVERNAFYTILEGLRMWQLKAPENSREWKIIFVGEKFDPSLISELISARVVGKATIKDYAELLSKASIGISLMLSPHPSYPPLEMCSAGLKTITNKFDGKDLTQRSVFINNIEQVSPEGIVKTLDKLVVEFNPSRDSKFYPINQIQSDLPIVDYSSVLKILLKD